MELKEVVRANIVTFVISIVSGHLFGILDPTRPIGTGVLLLTGGAVVITVLYAALYRALSAKILVYGLALAIGWNAGYLAYAARRALAG